MTYGNRTSGLLYLLPYLIGLAVFTLFPFVASLLLSFSDYRLQDSLGAAQLVGFENYAAILHDRTFGKSLVVTLIYVFVTRSAVSLLLWPKIPQNDAGTRIEPPKSPPNSSDVSPAATAAAPPPVLPPGVRLRSQGLLLRPKSGLADCQSLA